MNLLLHVRAINKLFLASLTMCAIYIYIYIDSELVSSQCVLTIDTGLIAQCVLCIGSRLTFQCVLYNIQYRP